MMLNQVSTWQVLSGNLTVILVLMMAVTVVKGADRMTGRSYASRSEVIAQHGAAATSHPLATQIAIDILKRGGSAVDAAIAANAALGLMEPTGCGIGGDLFAMVWDAKSEKLHGLNASGRSPHGLSLDHFRLQGFTAIPPYGPLPITVPGCVDGWFELHKRLGRLTMAEVLAPAIRYARDGFPVTELIAHYWARGGTRLKEYPNFAATYLPGGKAPAKGDVFRNPDLARTYEVLAADGRDAFYRGALTGVMASFFERTGCFLRQRDFAEHSSTWVEPVATTYRGFEVWELPPNGQGIAVLQMLNILEPFDLRGMGHNSADYLHHLIEAKKLAFEDRARFYADPDFSRVPVAELVSKAYAAQRRKLFDGQSAARTFEAGDPRLSTSETTYLTVADRDRNMVSLIQSNYRGFGSGLVPDGLGFCLQDRGELFSLEDGHPNVYAPHKRPFHTIIPGFVTKGGRPWLSFGVMGGDMQPQGHVQVLCNLIDFAMNVQEAGDAPRFHHVGSSEPTGEKMTDGGYVALESGIDREVKRDLFRRGHQIRFESDGFGGYQAILYDAERDLYIAGSDGRKDGQAAGY